MCEVGIVDLRHAGRDCRFKVCGFGQACGERLQIEGVRVWAGMRGEIADLRCAGLGRHAGRGEIADLRGAGWACRRGEIADLRCASLGRHARGEIADLRCVGLGRHVDRIVRAAREGFKAYQVLICDMVGTIR